MLNLEQWGVFESYCSSPARLLLWDCDDRTYSYYIDVSTDQNHWTRVVDKSQEATRSWQVVQFDPLLVTFIKIVGTHNTANEVSHTHAPASFPRCLGTRLMTLDYINFTHRHVQFACPLHPPNHPHSRS